MNRQRIPQENNRQKGNNRQANNQHPNWQPNHQQTDDPTDYQTYQHVLTDNLIVRPTDPPDSVLAAYVREDGSPRPKPPMRAGVR